MLFTMVPSAIDASKLRSPSLICAPAAMTVTNRASSSGSASVWLNWNASSRESASTDPVAASTEALTRWTASGGQDTREARIAD